MNETETAYNAKVKALTEGLKESIRQSNFDWVMSYSHEDGWKLANKKLDMIIDYQRDGAIVFCVHRGAHFLINPKDMEGMMNIYASIVLDKLLEILPKP
jgi:hypothetical protein